MDTKQYLTCIVCPMGCKLEVDTSGDEISVTGNGCKLGIRYATDEINNPTRMVTSSIKVVGGDQPLVSVKTRWAIPKGMIEEALQAIQGMQCDAPVTVGDVLISDVGGSGIDVVATRNVYKVI